MIVVDSSALVAIVLGEEDRNIFVAALHSRSCVVAAPTLVEAGVAIRRKRGEVGAAALTRLMEGASIRIEPFAEEHVGRAWQGFEAYGKGRHPAKLNFGDCFSYALAMHLGEPLLYKGSDFAQTDVRSALAA